MGTSVLRGYVFNNVYEIYLDVQAPEVLVVVELLGRGELPAKHVEMVFEKRRLVGTPGRGGVGRLYLAPLVLLHVPPASTSTRDKIKYNQKNRAQRNK